MTPEDKPAVVGNGAPAGAGAPTGSDAPGEGGAPAPVGFGARRAWRALAVFLGAQVAVAGVVGVYAAMHSLGKGGPPSPGGIQIDARVTLAAAFGGTLLAGLAVLRLVRKAFAEPGGDLVRAAVGWAGTTPRACLRAALGGAALVVVFVALGSFLSVRPHEMGPLARAANAGGWARLLWAALAVAIAPPVEELVFRGAFYAGLARSWRPATASAVTTAVFVALHVTELGAYWPAWIAIAALGALALRARQTSGSLLPAIALHVTYNLGLVLLVYAQ